MSGDRCTWREAGVTRRHLTESQRALIGASRGRLTIHLPSDPGDRPVTDDPPAPRLLTEEGMRQIERKNLIAVLDNARWKIAGPGGAADFLGMHAATLTSRLKVMGIERPRSSNG